MKEFEVTEEILKLFENKKLTMNIVAKLIPNYMDYALDLKERRIQYSPTAAHAAETFRYLVSETLFMTKKQFLNKIQDIFKDLNDDAEFCFNGEYLIDGGDYYINTFEEVTFKENNTLVLNKITNKIKKAIKENKVKDNTISDDMLKTIASNPELMKKFSEIQKGIRNEIKR